MTDLIYLAATVLAFAALALLVGALDRIPDDDRPASATPPTPETADENAEPAERTAP